MIKVGTIITIIAIIVAFEILALSFASVNEIKPPSQDNGTNTGYPVWHPPLPIDDDQKNAATIIFSIVLLILSGCFAFKWTMFDTKSNSKLLTYFVDGEANKVPTITFDRLIATYCLVTSLTGIVYYLIDVGKIWSTVGVLHNANEIAVLVALHQGGRITSNSFVAWLTFYVVFAGALSIYLDWPYDALWFKVQGLCSDYSLVIQFTRLYFNTRKEYGNESRQRLFDPERPRRDNTTGESAVLESEQINDRTIGPFHPNHILFLILGSFTHIVGNIITTIWIYHFSSYVIFSFTYCITYPLYAYFIYLDTHTVAIPPTQKYIILPDTSTFKVILVTSSSIFLSLLTARLGMMVQN